MTTTVRLDVAALRADLAAAEHDFDRTDDLGDSAAVVRMRRSLMPRLERLRAAIARAERDTTDRSRYVAD
jgi:hypothetical protein